MDNQGDQEHGNLPERIVNRPAITDGGSNRSASFPIPGLETSQQLPITDTVKRDDLLIYGYKKVIDLANFMAKFSVVAHFVSTEIGRPWVPFPWVVELIIGVYTGYIVRALIPTEWFGKAGDFLVAKCKRTFKW